MSSSTTPVHAGSIQATLDFVSSLSLDEMSKKLGDALDLNFHDDVEGKYEEYPAVVGNAAGLRFALLAAPHPEDDIREDKTADYQLVAHSEVEGTVYALPTVDLSAYFANLIERRAGISCEPFSEQRSA